MLPDARTRLRGRRGRITMLAPSCEVGAGQNFLNFLRGHTLFSARPLYSVAGAVLLGPGLRAHEQCYIAKKDGYVKVVLEADRSQPLTTCWALGIFAKGDLLGIVRD